MIQTAERLKDIQEYYFSKKLREVALLRNQGKPIINMAIGSPDLDPPATVVKALQEALLDKGVHQYQSYQGIPQLRQAIVDFYQKAYEVSLNSDNEVLPLMGSKEGIMHISMAFLNPQDIVLIPNPGYPTYASVTKLLQAQVLTYDLYPNQDWLIDIDALEQLPEDVLERSKILWVNYPHMPTGAKATKATYQRLIEFAKRYSILIVNDNPYSFILNNDPNSILALQGAKEVCLELNSLSKTFNMAGWRVGMVCGDSSLIQQVLKVKSNMDSGMFKGIQKGAIEALNMSEDWYKSINVIYRQRRKLVYQLADLLGTTYNKDAVGMFVWAKLPNGTDEVSFIDKLLYEYDIFITPGSIFGTQGKGYIRFSLCVDQTNIENAIERITNKPLLL